MPPLEQVFDTAGLRAGLANLDPAIADQIIVSIWQTSPRKAYVLGDSAPSGGSLAILDVVVSALLPPHKDLPIAMRAVVWNEAGPQVRLERSVVCNPEPVGPVPPLRVPFSFVGRRSDAPPPPPRIRHRVRISESGRVLEVDLQGGTGGFEADRAIREHAAAIRYHPALLDGRPVEVWLSEGRVDVVH